MKTVTPQSDQRCTRGQTSAAIANAIPIARAVQKTAVESPGTGSTSGEASAIAQRSRASPLSRAGGIAENASVMASC